MAAKKHTYHARETDFGGQKITLYSIDGLTWSTRKEELAEIMERHEYERNNFGDIKGRIIKKEGESDQESEVAKGAPNKSATKVSKAAAGKMAEDSKKNKQKEKVKSNQTKVKKALLPQKPSSSVKKGPVVSKVSKSVAKQKAAAPNKRTSAIKSKKTTVSKARKKNAA